ncbi:MAG: hypothetical protein ACE5FW_01225 [Candidatus Aenigmatarchaeota archaeon]
MAYTEAEKAERRKALHNYINEHGGDTKYISLPSDMVSILQTEYNGNLSNAKKDAGASQEDLENLEEGRRKKELESFGEYVKEMGGIGISVTKTLLDDEGTFSWLVREYKGRVNDMKRDAGVSEFINTRKGSKNKLSRPDITKRGKRK